MSSYPSVFAVYHYPVEDAGTRLGQTAELIPRFYLVAPAQPGFTLDLLFSSGGLKCASSAKLDITVLPLWLCNCIC